MEDLGVVLSQGTLRGTSGLSTFISVGNATQPFNRLLDKVAEIVHRLPPPVFVQRGSTVFELPACEVHAFVSMEDFSTRISSASLVILHAGAGSVIHAVRAGKIPVVVPRRAKYGEIADDHQVEFAVEMEKSGRAIVAMEPSDLENAVSRALTLQATIRQREIRSPLVAMVRERLEAYAEERA